ncbi:siphovirus Gp157 family protein [Amedibacillus sp. YH-ame6]
MRSLYEIDKEYLELFNRFDPETGEVLFTDEELDSIKQEFETKADNIACLIKDKKSLIDARKAEMKTLKERNDLEEKQVDRLCNYLVRSMLMRNKKKLETARNLISTRNSKSVFIENESLIPKEYLKKKIEKFPMKKEIGEALKNGLNVAGCKLQENTSLIVK